ncbi:hypothetical protein [Kordiimonas gwangyangensis]|uniref:hypothetical protein n=1 Tax=Kordiimonas gwangyangensis TaxID=288022 RepID=UPI00037B89AF|nr:hypothetical protein [Kordiimonas gwangyangensis]
MAKASDLFASGVSNHAGLTGLGADDHPQYLNNTRGDVRYYGKAAIDTALAGKANASHGHTLASLSDVAISAIGDGEVLVWSVSGFINRTLTEAGIAAANHSHAWSAITGKPSTFTPTVHSHAIADVTGLQAALDAKAASTHGHAVGDLSNVTITSIAAGEVLQWDGSKFINRTLGEAGIAAASHSHTKADIGLANVDNTSDADKPVSTATQAALDGKAATSHSHAISNVTGLQAALDGKAASSHAHTFASLTGKPTTLSGYGISDAATASHSHTWAAITGKPSSFAPSAHSHPISDVTGLQAALDSKATHNRVVVTAAHTATNEQVVAVNSSAGAITITAPASPVTGTYFYVADVGANAENNNITVDFGARSFNGSAQDFVLDVSEFGTGFIYIGSTWRLLR